jgi:hypothetical protein
MVIDVRAHLDLFDLDDLLLLLGFGFFLLLLILVLAVIEYLADRRLRVGRNFDQVEPGAYGDLNCFLGRYDPAFFTCVIDEKDLRNTNLLVDARSVVLRRRG